MTKRMIITLAVVLAASVATYYVAGAGQSVACDSKQASTAASCSKSANATTADAGTCSSKSAVRTAGLKGSCSATTASAGDCEKHCEAIAAKITADKHECCKQAVSAVMVSWAQTCSDAKTGTAGTAEKKSCSASASTAASKDHCESAASKVAAHRAECCEKTVAAFVSAVHAEVGEACSQAASLKTAGSSGCSKTATASATAGGKDCCDKSKAASAGDSCGKSADTSAAFADLGYREGKRLVLSGYAICGKCDLNATEKCQPAFKAMDGSAYPLVKNAKAKEIRHAKAGNGYEIVTYVRRLDGIKYLEVVNYKAL